MAIPGISDAKPAGGVAPEHDRHDRERWRAEANFWAVFESAPDAYLLLASDPPHWPPRRPCDSRAR